VIGLIGVIGCVVGAIQYWMNGTVSIRPGHDRAVGDVAVTMLLFLFFVSAALIVYGRVTIHRARRILDERKDSKLSD